jgi:hypothetical protein
VARIAYPRATAPTGAGGAPDSPIPSDTVTKRIPGVVDSSRRVAATVPARSPPLSCSITIAPRPAAVVPPPPAVVPPPPAVVPASPAVGIAAAAIASAPGRRQSSVSRSARTTR